MQNQESPKPTSQPLIGIPVQRDYFEREPLWGNAGGYRSVNEILLAIEEAGGNGVVLFPGEELPDIDGLLLPGGGDVDPSFYGQQSHSEVKETDLELDAFQIELTKEAFRKDLPVLGICRGMQIMNVASGGTLIQHLEEATPQEHFPLDAKVDPDLRSNPVHSVTVKADSLLARAVGPGEVAVNSLHHQAADSVAEGFTVVARAEDGVVEAIEGPGSFQLGVQFHPEDLRKSDSRFQELFVGLVKSTLVFA